MFSAHDVYGATISATVTAAFFLAPLLAFTTIAPVQLQLEQPLEPPVATYVFMLPDDDDSEAEDVEVDVEHLIPPPAEAAQADIEPVVPTPPTPPSDASTDKPDPVQTPNTAAQVSADSPAPEPDQTLDEQRHPAEPSTSEDQTRTPEPSTNDDLVKETPTRPKRPVASPQEEPGALSPVAVKTHRPSRKSQCRQPHPQVHRVGTAAYEVEGDLIKYYTAKMERLNTLGYSKRYAEDEIKGWMIGGFGCKSPLWQAGLRSRDVVRSVNGKKTYNIVQIFGLWLGQRHKKEFLVTVLRRGKEVTLHYTVV
jgi:hypothetical protein